MVELLAVLAQMLRLAVHSAGAWLALVASTEHKNYLLQFYVATCKMNHRYIPNPQIVVVCITGRQSVNDCQKISQLNHFISLI